MGTPTGVDVSIFVKIQALWQHIVFSERIVAANTKSGFTVSHFKKVLNLSKPPLKFYLLVKKSIYNLQFVNYCQTDDQIFKGEGWNQRESKQHKWGIFS